jgi:hypothetical protein
MKTKGSFTRIACLAMILALSSTAYAGSLHRVNRLRTPTKEGPAPGAKQERSTGLMSGSLVHPSQGMGREDQFKGLFDKPGNR